MSQEKHSPQDLLKEFNALSQKDKAEARDYALSFMKERSPDMSLPEIINDLASTPKDRGAAGYLVKLSMFAVGL